MIRELRESDAEAVSRLLITLNPHQIVTPRAIWYRATRNIQRERRREWVAELGGEIVGWAQAGFEWAVRTAGKGRFWLGVEPTRRGRGVGSELHETAVGYLRAEGAWRLQSWVDGDPAGVQFLRRRGFERAGGDRVSELDLARANVSALPELEASKRELGFRLAALGEVRSRPHELHAICAEGELDMPSDEPETEVDFDSWLREELEHPELSDEGSMVVLDGERPVSLAFLTVDPARRVGYNAMTATLRDYRRRGLALLAKLAVVCWSANAGLERLVTENDDENTGMLAINRRLGYRPLYFQEYFVRVMSR